MPQAHVHRADKACGYSLGWGNKSLVESQFLPDALTRIVFLHPAGARHVKSCALFLKKPATFLLFTFVFIGAGVSPAFAVGAAGAGGAVSAALKANVTANYTEKMPVIKAGMESVMRRPEPLGNFTGNGAIMQQMMQGLSQFAGKPFQMPLQMIMQGGGQFGGMLGKIQGMMKGNVGGLFGGLKLGDAAPPHEFAASVVAERTCGVTEGSVQPAMGSGRLLASPIVLARPIAAGAGGQEELLEINPDNHKPKWQNKPSPYQAPAEGEVPPCTYSDTNPCQ